MILLVLCFCFKMYPSDDKLYRMANNLFYTIFRVPKYPYRPIVAKIRTQYRPKFNENTDLLQTGLLKNTDLLNYIFSGLD